MCRDDGPGNRWTEVYSLGYQPSAYHTALPTPQSSSIFGASTAPAPLLTPHFNSIVPGKPPVLLDVSSPPQPSVSPPLELFLSLSFPSSMSSGRNWLSARQGPNPLIFLLVVPARAAIALFLPPLPLCWVKARAQIPRSQPHAVHFIVCWSTALDKFSSQEALHIRLTPSLVAGKRSDYSNPGC